MAQHCCSPFTVCFWWFRERIAFRTVSLYLSVSSLRRNEEWLENMRLPEILPSFIHSAQATSLSSKHLFTPGLRNHNQVLFLCLSFTSLRHTQSPEIPRYLHFYGNYSLCINGGQLMIKMAPRGMKIEKYSGQRSLPEMQNQSKMQ